MIWFKDPTKYKRIKYEWSGNDPIYIGFNIQWDAATSDVTWQIEKRAYAASVMTDTQTIKNQAWDNRAGLSWDI